MRLDRAIDRVRELTAVRLRRRRAPIPRPIQPDTIRLEYAKAITRLLGQAREVIEARILPKARRILARNEKRDADDDINDDFDDVGRDFFDDVMKPGKLRELAKTVAARTSDHSRRELKKQAETAIGVDVFGAEPNLAKATAAFVQQNVALIKSIPSRYFDDVEKTVARFASEGRRWEELAKELQERFNVAESSARLVARDQVGKFFGALAKERQEKLGVTHYFWRTMNDGDRVRDLHQEYNGQRFAWNDPPADGHPGEAINCRCYAEPDFAAMLGEEEEQVAAPEPEPALELEQPVPEPVEVAAPTPLPEPVPAPEPPPPPPAPEPPKAKPAQLSATQQKIMDEAAKNAEKLAKGAPKGMAKGRERLKTAPITMNFPAGKVIFDESRGEFGEEVTVLEAMNDSGRAKPLAEVGTGEGSTNKSERDAWERNNFGPEVTAQPPAERPIYGAINVLDKPDGAASDYGGSWFVLKEEVKDRTTLTHTDSSETRAADVVTARNPDGILIDKGAAIEAGRGTGYVEAQIHGGVDFTRDVAEIHVDKDDWQNPKIRAAAEEMSRKSGAKLFVYDYDAKKSVPAEAFE